MTTIDGRTGPHSRACGYGYHDHGPACAADCPTCNGAAPTVSRGTPTLHDLACAWLALEAGWVTPPDPGDPAVIAQCVTSAKRRFRPIGSKHVARPEAIDHVAALLRLPVADPEGELVIQLGDGPTWERPLVELEGWTVELLTMDGERVLAEFQGAGRDDGPGAVEVLRWRQFDREAGEAVGPVITSKVSDVYGLRVY